MNKPGKFAYWRLKALAIGLVLSSLACLGGIFAVSSSRGEANVVSIAARQKGRAQDEEQASRSDNFVNRGTLLPFYRGNQREPNIDVFYDNVTGCEYFVVERQLSLQVLPRFGADGKPNGCGNV